MGVIQVRSEKQTILCEQQVLPASLSTRTSQLQLLGMIRPRQATRFTGLPILGERDTNFTELSRSFKINHQRDGTRDTYQIFGR